jgi:hypothetical protein
MDTGTKDFGRLGYWVNRNGRFETYILRERNHRIIVMPSCNFHSLVKNVTYWVYYSLMFIAYFAREQKAIRCIKSLCFLQMLCILHEVSYAIDFKRQRRIQIHEMRPRWVRIGRESNEIKKIIRLQIESIQTDLVPGCTSMTTH